METLQDKQGFTDLDDLLRQVDIRKAVSEALLDILKTDDRHDQFRSVKVFLLYQAGILDSIEERLSEISRKLDNQPQARTGKVIGSIAALKAKKK